MELTSAPHIPYAAAAEWYAALCADMLGAGEAPAPVRHPNRTFIRPAGKNSAVMQLTVPLAHSRAYRHADAMAAEISEHGNWRHTHAEALRASYGRSPFWEHYSSPLLDIYSRQFSCLRQFNMAIHEFVCRSIGLPASIEELRRQAAAKPELFAAVCAEAKRGSDFGLSILDALFRLGPDTIFLLLPAL